MRTLRAKDFLKIVTGNDLEFRMTSYQFQLEDHVLIENVTVKGSLTFEDCQAKSLGIELSEFEKVALQGVRTNRFYVRDNRSIGSLNIDASLINELDVSGNHRFDTLHIGCANEIKKALLTSNGFHNGHGDSSHVYLCPERFCHLEIDRLNSGKLEFGTFGEFSKMRVNDVTANEVALDNCTNANSDVVFTNIRPKEQGATKFRISNSNIGPEVLTNSEVKEFDQFSVENSSIVEELSMLNHINQRKRGNFSRKLAGFLFFTW
jgi:hypothetical protein